MSGSDTTLSDRNIAKLFPFHRNDLELVEEVAVQERMRTQPERLAFD
jgi:hypothetical protein